MPDIPKVAQALQIGVVGMALFTGTLNDRGVVCPAMDGEDGELYVFTHLPDGLAPGDRIRVEGETRPLQPSTCDQGVTIYWSRIMRIAPGGEQDGEWIATE